MKANGFEQVHKLACEAFFMGETLVLQDAKRTVCVQPQFQWKLPALKVTALGQDGKAMESKELGKHQFDGAEFEGMEIPGELAALLKGAHSG